jgi:hypothetical protein
MCMCTQTHTHRVYRTFASCVINYPVKQGFLPQNFVVWVNQDSVNADYVSQYSNRSRETILDTSNRYVHTKKSSTLLWVSIGGAG